MQVISLTAQLLMGDPVKPYQENIGDEAHKGVYKHPDGIAQGSRGQLRHVAVWSDFRFKKEGIGT